MLCRDSAPWVYRLERSFCWQSGLTLPEDFVFFDSAGKVWLIIDERGQITVLKGYAWNGCTPKVCVLDLLVGTPEGAVYEGTCKRKTYYASLVHDALYQFLREASPLKRRDADRFFLCLMQESDFVLARVYWLVVRALGWAFWQGTSRKREWHGQRERRVDLQPPDLMPPSSPNSSHPPPSGRSPAGPSPDPELSQPSSEGEDNETR